MVLLSPHSARGILTMSSAGLQLSPSIILFWVYLLIIHIMHILPFVSHTFLVYIFPCVFLSHLLEFLLSRNVSLQSCSDYHTPPPSQPLVSTLLAGTTLLKTYHRPHPSLYKLLSGQTAFFCGFFFLDDGTP
jgi:hypothetical protein